MRILTISDNPSITTGLARVHRHAISSLNAAGHEVLPCVWFGYDGKQQMALGLGGKHPELYYDGVRMLTVPKRTSSMSDMKAIYDICVAFKPDIIFTIGDYSDFYYMQALKSKLDYAFRWVAWLTVEVDHFDSKLLPLFNFANALVVPSEYSRSALQKVCSTEVKIIPYGVEDAFFEDLPSKESSKKTRFVTVAANTWRKDLPSLIVAASVMKRNGLTPENFGFDVHTITQATEPSDPCLYDLPKLCEDMGVSDYFSFPSSNSVFNGISDSEMAKKFQNSDFFVLPSVCESFALPVVEAMACGCPLIGNSTSALAEHMRHGRGIPLLNRIEVCPPSHVVRRVDPVNMAHTLTLACRTWQDERYAMSDECRKYAKGFRWSETERRICSLVDGITKACEVPVEIIG